VALPTLGLDSSMLLGINPTPLAFAIGDVQLHDQLLMYVACDLASVVAELPACLF
jgi:hypothetical protein